MKNELFSGFDDIKSTDTLKQKIIKNAVAGNTIKAGRHKAYWKFVPMTACFAVVLLFTASSSLFVMRYGTPAVDGVSSVSSEAYSNNAQQRVGCKSARLLSDANGFVILKKPPSLKAISGFRKSIAVMPTEQQIYSSSSTIVFGEVADIKWVLIPGEKSSDSLSYDTIVTVKISNEYKGDVKTGDSIDILLPVCISGNGSGWIEDNENAAKLKKGSKAFFFAYEYGKDDYAGDKSLNLRWRDICRYGTAGGDQTVITESSGGFNYFFPTCRKLTFNGVEKEIKRACSGQYAK